MVQNAVIYDKVKRSIIVPTGGDGSSWTYGGNTEAKKKIIEDSYDDALKDVIRDQAKHQEKFNKLVSRASHVLYRADTVFPFDFFPTSITVDPEKVTIRIKNFFLSSEIRSIHVKNISHIFVDTGPFFATLNIIDQSILDDNVGKIQIAYLRKHEAMKVRRIVQGLIVADKEGVDLFKLQKKDMTQKLEEIGRMQ